ncbi:bifunctional diguanylate cyclase/phosphodiesterase [Ruminococcus sp.]|uniref:putative bifunctional diguanylate cyclase/phosphodiesterase n=1 Tax=Ruminococcus sp. TaxID=41978 RepID=UPI0025EB2A1D|nr:EAL domain-containing response regulator [Ruminococcus sp.]MCR4638795.1 EAL domain-containing protein [Ruminococcus sp.]
MKELLERKKGLRRSILIVDDDYIAREILGKILKDQYEISYAENGVIALDIIKRDKLKLSLVILDLHMPQMDGYSLLKLLRSDNELRRIPVIVLISEKGAEVESLKIGAADFITKPFDMPEVICARVSHSIELAEDSVIIHETERDELTGLFHKEFFFQYGKRLDELNNHMPMDAVMIDINRFHIVNELYGRRYGDQVLRTVGESLHELVSKNGGIACRRDNDQFYVYLPHNDELKGKLPHYIAVIDKRINDSSISLRFGVYSDDGSEKCMEHRFDYARLACQKLRNSYVSCFNFYNDEQHSKELYAERLINDMDKALSEKQFKVYYQPKYSIRGSRPQLSSAEALIRWFHPEFGMVSPGQFISLFEENGLIQKLDRFVWNEAAAQIKLWKDKYGTDIPVSVNVSRVDMFNAHLVEILESITRQNGLKNAELLLEITESAYTDDSDQIIETVNTLRKCGFRIEMDDFGSGYSSLNMLTALPIDALKLDMKFIRTICEKPKSARLVGIMIDIARLLEVPVIAEGVETKEQMELLKKLGCDIIQGYYFSKPLPPEEFGTLIEKELKEKDHAYN